MPLLPARNRVLPNVFAACGTIPKHPASCRTVPQCLPHLPTLCRISPHSAASCLVRAAGAVSFSATILLRLHVRTCMVIGVNKYRGFPKARRRGAAPRYLLASRDQTFGHVSQHVLIFVMASDEGKPCVPKRAKIDSNTDTSKHLDGYKRQWEAEFPWLLAIQNDITLYEFQACCVAFVKGTKQITRWCSWNTDLAFTTLLLYTAIEATALFIQQHVKGAIIAQQ